MKWRQSLTSEVVGVVEATDGAAAKHHLIFGERSRLVGEDVLDLPEVLVDVERPALEGLVSGLVVHGTVPVDEVHLDELHYLQGHVQGDWNNDLVLRGKTKSGILYMYI